MSQLPFDRPTVARPGEIPPRLESGPGSAAVSGSRRAWGGLVLLAGYVVLPGVLGLLRGTGDAAVLPGSLGALLWLCAWELALFSGVLGLVVWGTRLTAGELRLRGGMGWWAVPRAIGWSVALRLGVGLALAVTVVAGQRLGLVSTGNLEAIRPRIEAMVDIGALRDPAYLAVMLTLVSFGVAGLREELWRAGMLALLARLGPRWFGGPRGAWLAILPVALLFGLGHTPQGPAGVAVTTLLGVGLGAVMVFHRSTWDAVLAHGFFNATTFAILPWLATRYPEVLG